MTTVNTLHLLRYSLKRDRASIFSGIVVVGICVVLIVYLIVSEIFKFYMFGIPLPGTNLIELRLMGCMLIWTMLCLSVIWYAVFLKKATNRRLFVWPVVLIPFLMGLGISGWRVWCAISDGKSVRVYGHLNVPYLFSIVIPAFEGISLSCLILGTACLFYKYSLPESICDCGYDLTGNTSGRCPECGTSVRLG